MTDPVGNVVWNSAALLAKSQLYFEEMTKNPRDEWQFGLWSGLALELLARAALARVSPVLLADPKDWNNIYNALGHTPNVPRFNPKSISITEVFSRIKDIHPELSSEIESAAVSHIHRRNSELHSGEQPFSGISPSSWLPNYYRACEVLIQSLGLTLADLLGPDQATVASKIVAAAKDQSAKAVSKLIDAHTTVWKQKDEVEQKKLQLQASIWATKQDGHRVTCPSCGSPALVHGDPIAPPQKSIKDDMITEMQEHLPNRFECIACGLKIAGLSQLAAAGLSDSYLNTQTYDASVYYSPDEDNIEYESSWEDDNNEPM